MGLSGREIGKLYNTRDIAGTMDKKKAKKQPAKAVLAQGKF
jgi:hypothetical protein